MNKFLRYGTIAAVAMASVPNFAQAARWIVEGAMIGPGGVVITFVGWVDPDTGHGAITWNRGGSSGTVSWFPAMPGEGNPLHHVDNLDQLMSEYGIDAKDGDGTPLDLDKWGDFILGAFNQSVDQVDQN